MANTTWSSADQVNTTLTGSNLVATSASGNAAVRATDSFTTGKYYWECTFTTAANTDTGVGIASEIAYLPNLGSNALLAAVIYKGFPVFVNGIQYVPTTNIGTIAAGSVVGIACDFGAKLIWFRLGAAGSWNATSGTTNNPATGVGGVSFSAVPGPFAPAASMWSTSDSVTANFGDTTFAGTAPSGFTSGVPHTPFTPSFTTWNPADRSSIQLSGNNLVATEITGGAWVRAVDRQVSGKFYWEVQLAQIGLNNPIIGFCLGGVTPTSTGVGLAAVFCNTGIIWVNSVNSGSTLGARAVNDIISVAVDLGAQLVWFRVAPSGNWNGSSTANPATGAGGISVASVARGGLPTYPLALFGASGAAAIIADFGDSAFSGTVPSGFTSGFTPGASISTNVLTTQAAVEEWYAPTPAMQLTQAAVEQWQVLSPDAQLTQIAAEHWLQPNPDAQVTQLALEQWSNVDPSPLWVTQVALEHWSAGSAAVQIAMTQAALEHWTATVASAVPAIGPMITTIF